jgi:hypothetical protein
MRTIDLTGPEGNAFNMLGLAKKWGEQMNLDTKELLTDMKSGDYDHLIEVFEKHFGAVCELIKPEDDDEDEESW